MTKYKKLYEQYKGESDESWERILQRTSDHFKVDKQILEESIVSN